MEGTMLRKFLVALPIVAVAIGGSSACATKKYVKGFHVRVNADTPRDAALARSFGAEGIEPDSDKALFENVNIETKVAGIPLKIPILTGAFKPAPFGTTASRFVLALIVDHICSLSKNTRVLWGSKNME
jgi:hypothetical protein